MDKGTIEPQVSLHIVEAQQDHGGQDRKCYVSLEGFQIPVLKVASSDCEENDTLMSGHQICSPTTGMGS